MSMAFEVHTGETRVVPGPWDASESDGLRISRAISRREDVRFGVLSSLHEYDDQCRRAEGSVLSPLPRSTESASRSVGDRPSDHRAMLQRVRFCLQPDLRSGTDAKAGG